MEFGEGSAELVTCSINCSMTENEKGHFEIVATTRLITASLSIIGSLSIICSAIYRKTVCNPKVHPIFVLSIADTLLSVLWISGALVWLTAQGLKHSHNLRVGCFTINLTTVILQCVAMNVTLIYALLAYYSIKQRDFSGVYIIQQRPLSVHVWPPFCSFMAYFIAWILPIFLIMIPFGVIAVQYRVVSKANDCSCWCLPYYGNVLPHAMIGPQNGEEGNHFLEHLHYFITSYASVLVANFTLVLCCMGLVYFKIFRRIKRMILAQDNENTHLLGATSAMILAGQKDAKKRVLFFLSSFFITGAMTFSYGLININISISLAKNQKKDNYSLHRDEILTFYFLFVEALLVPSQGFLNALAYGWTRGDFLSVMSMRNVYKSQSETFGDTMEEEEETEVEAETENSENEEMCNSFISSSSIATVKERGVTALTPMGPGQ